MRKFNLTLAAIALVLLLLTCSYNVYLLRRPMFVQKQEVDQSARRVLDDIPGGRVLQYQIGRNLLQGLYYRKYIDHYRDGELVERYDRGSGSIDYMLGTRSFVQLYIYSGVDREAGVCWFGLGSAFGSGYGTLQFKPDDKYHYPTFVGPDKLRFEKNKLLTLAVLAFSDQVWPSSQPGPAFDKSGVLKPEALQHGDIFLVQFEFVDSLVPKD